ncbi:MAG: FAD:protein FMN transferase [Oliverpabstia sp.]
MKCSNIIWVVFLGCLFVSGCGSENREMDIEYSEEVTLESEDPVTNEIFAMDTYMVVTAYGDTAQEAVDEAVVEIRRLDEKLSTGDENSEIYALNVQGGGNISEDTEYLIERSLEIWEDTDGRFEIGIYPVMKLWGFTDGEYKVPSEETLQKLLTMADSSQIILDEEKSTVSFGKKGMQIDLGGIAKGYTSSRIMDIFRDHGVTSGLVSLGGNVQVLGNKPDGSKWRVAIQSPTNEEEYLGVLEAEDCAVITSGGYERYFEEDGITYHHIIDPSTGYPADSGLDSVTIVSKDGTLADGLSTALFIMGKEQAQKFWSEHNEEFDVIMLDDDGVLYVTEGISDHFSSNLDVIVLEKQENKD